MAALGEGYHVFASPDLPADHAWLVTRALDHAALGRRPASAPLPLHPGAVAFRRGEAMPE